METLFGQPATDPANDPFDKTRVLDVKPLRSLVPLFPQNPQVPPFVSSLPTGPFPPGFTPFYPFNAPQGLYNNANVDVGVPFGHSTPEPAPIRAYQSPQPVSSVPPQFSNTGERGTYDGGYSDEPQHKKARMKQATENRPAVPRKKVMIGLERGQQEDGNTEIVDYVRTMFDAVWRRVCQVEESRSGKTGSAYMTAASILSSNEFKTNAKKRIGNVPGVEIGDIFFYRIEMCLVGLHAQSMAGIDYLKAEQDTHGEPLAVSIVSAGGYDNDVDDKDVLIYSGQGGAVNKKQVSGQKLEKGNLALEKSLQRGNVVRVIRGFPDVSSPSSTAKVYVYDGLYTVTKSWTEAVGSGGSIFKYQLVRSLGQTSAFDVWKSVEKWRDGFASRVGLILPDLTSGAESIPVSLVNDVDAEKGPSYFTYFPSLKYSESMPPNQQATMCDCRASCNPGDSSCHCLQKNGGNSPYLNNGILVSRKPLLFECGSSCHCFPNCKTRVSQSGLKVRLEVFKTTDRGWGLRSWDPIRAGTFICEFAGEVVDKSKGNRTREDLENDEYVFDTTRLFDNSLKWNYEPRLLDEGSPDEPFEDEHVPNPLVISAKNFGNVSRFMNHSCWPNLFWQPITYGNNGVSTFHIAFFARKNIPPMTELTYDYGISLPDGVDSPSTGVAGGKYKCLCNTEKCRGYFG